MSMLWPAVTCGLLPQHPAPSPLATITSAVVLGFHEAAVAVSRWRTSPCCCPSRRCPTGRSSRRRVGRPRPGADARAAVYVDGPVDCQLLRAWIPRDRSRPESCSCRGSRASGSVPTRRLRLLSTCCPRVEYGHGAARGDAGEVRSRQREPVPEAHLARRRAQGVGHRAAREGRDRDQVEGSSSALVHFRGRRRTRYRGPTRTAGAWAGLVRARAVHVHGRNAVRSTCADPWFFGFSRISFPPTATLFAAAEIVAVFPSVRFPVA